MIRKRYIFLLLLLGCQDPVAPKFGKYASLQVVSGDGQAGQTGVTLAQDIVLRVTPQASGLDPSHFFVQSAVDSDINGHFQWVGVPGGNIGGTAVFADAGGTITGKWKLGCSRKNQALTLYLYYSDSCQSSFSVPCQPIDSVSIRASATTPAGWNKSCGLRYEIDRYNTKIKTFNNTLYALHVGHLYRGEQEEGLSWVEIDVPFIADYEHFIFDFGFTSAGKVYVLTDGAGVYTSDDFVNWTSESNGILDTRYAASLLVEDSVVYASFQYEGLYRLRPGQSNFWKKLLINGQTTEEYSFLTRHPDGKLYLIDKWDKYWVSQNSGNSWAQVPLGYQYHVYETRDLKIHPSGQIYIGSGDATLAIVDPLTYTGTAYKYYEYNASSQHVDNIVFQNSTDVYYLVNSTPNPGVYSSVIGWQKLNVGPATTQRIVLFAFDLNGNLLLGYGDGLYYLKE